MLEWLFGKKKEEPKVEAPAAEAAPVPVEVKTDETAAS